MTHQGRGGGVEHTTVTVNIGLGDDVYSVMNRAMADVNAGLFQGEPMGSPRGPVMIAALAEVVIGGYDAPNYEV